MKAKIVSVDPWSPALEVEIEDWPVVIGRSGRCEVWIDDRWIMPRHCEISQRDGQLVVRNLGSAGDTLIDGQPVELSPLLPNQILTLGIRMLRVSYRASTRKSAINGKRQKHAEALLPG